MTTWEARILDKTSNTSELITHETDSEPDAFAWFREHTPDGHTLLWLRRQ